jgi:hypothetical protein
MIMEVASAEHGKAGRYDAGDRDHGLAVARTTASP